MVEGPPPGCSRRKALSRAARPAILLALTLVSATAVLQLSGSLVAPAEAVDPHGGYVATTDKCALCHRPHTGANRNILSEPAPQSNLCFLCHDGTGASSNIAAQYSDPLVPANDPGTSSFYSHPATTVSTHTTALDATEFAGVLNRHSECGDCHDPHRANTSVVSSPGGSPWPASGALADISGVDTNTSWVDPITYEYELCYKCHSGYTQLLSYTRESYRKTDKAVEFDPSNASYHPVEAPGKNTNAELDLSLAGGTRWQFTTGDTIRCTNCHGNYRLGAPAKNARLAPHTSQYRGLLIANYRDRDLKPQNEAFSESDFALCFLCHDPEPFRPGGNNAATRFNRHSKHTAGITKEGNGGLDIDTPGDGQGAALCAECHFRVHGTALAPWAANQGYPRGINFAPNVTGPGGSGSPLWVPNGNGGQCTLRCHGKDHNPKGY